LDVIGTVCDIRKRGKGFEPIPIAAELCKVACFLRQIISVFETHDFRKGGQGFEPFPADAE
jgi:hypothetical protein